MEVPESFRPIYTHDSATLVLRHTGGGDGAIPARAMALAVAVIALGFVIGLLAGVVATTVVLSLLLLASRAGTTRDVRYRVVLGPRGVLVAELGDAPEANMLRRGSVRQVDTADSGLSLLLAAGDRLEIPANQHTQDDLSWLADAIARHLHDPGPEDTEAHRQMKALLRTT